MKRRTKLLAVGSLLALGGRWLWRRAGPPLGASASSGLGTDRTEAGFSPVGGAPDLDDAGIAEVDPVPLSHVAGEGIDLDGDVEAHTKIPEQRERLPRRGENLP